MKMTTYQTIQNAAEAMLKENVYSNQYLHLEIGNA